MSDSERTLEKIANTLESIRAELHKPFDDMRADSRLQLTLRTQKQNHQEMLNMQHNMNYAMILEMKESAKWTKVLAVATIILAVANIALVYITKQ